MLLKTRLQLWGNQAGIQEILQGIRALSILKYKKSTVLRSALRGGAEQKQRRVEIVHISEEESNAMAMCPHFVA